MISISWATTTISYSCSHLCSTLLLAAVVLFPASLSKLVNKVNSIKVPPSGIELQTDPIPIIHIQGDFFNWSRPKSSKCWRWQNPYQKSESKGISQRKYEVLTQTFTFLVGILTSPTLRTFRAGPVKKVTL